MYTWCTEHDWCAEDFDLDYAVNENGTFLSPEKARADAKKRGYDDGIVIVLEVC